MSLYFAILITVTVWCGMWDTRNKSNLYMWTHLGNNNFTTDPRWSSLMLRLSFALPAKIKHNYSKAPQLCRISGNLFLSYFSTAGVTACLWPFDMCCSLAVLDCIIEALANPERERMKLDDTNISMWLQSKHFSMFFSSFFFWIITSLNFICHNG